MKDSSDSLYKIQLDMKRSWISTLDDRSMTLEEMGDSRDWILHDH